ncbi:unnamed protein product [Boreogadus saida]
MVLDVSQNIGSLRFPCGQTYRNEFPGFSGPGGRGSSVMRGQHAPRRRLIAHRLVFVTAVNKRLDVLLSPRVPGTPAQRRPMTAQTFGNVESIWSAGAAEICGERQYRGAARHNRDVRCGTFLRALL